LSWCCSVVRYGCCAAPAGERAPLLPPCSLILLVSFPTAARSLQCVVRAGRLRLLALQPLPDLLHLLLHPVRGTRRGTGEPAGNRLADSSGVSSSNLPCAASAQHSTHAAQPMAPLAAAAPTASFRLPCCAPERGPGQASPQPPCIACRVWVAAPRELSLGRGARRGKAGRGLWFVSLEHHPSGAPAHVCASFNGLVCRRGCGDSGVQGCVRTVPALRGAAPPGRPAG